MLIVADLSAEAISKIRAYQWDGIIEKHISVAVLMLFVVYLMWLFLGKP